KALVQQGIHADKDNGRVLFNNFRNQEVDSIERLMNDYGWKRDIVGTNKIKDIHEYKEIMSEISELRQTAVKERESISAEMRYISKQREKNEREKALVASEKAKIEEEKKSIIDLEKELAVVFQKDPVPLNSFEKLSDGSYRLSSADFVDLYQKASNATNSKKYADMANESLGNTLDKNIALFDKNMALEQENSFLKNQQKVDVSAVVAENKKLKEENRSLRRRLTQLKNAFQKSITRLSIRFGLVEKDMGISEELKILDQEKTLASQQNAPERNIGRSENEMEW
ncbi:recombinase, partial [Enterococcus faecium]|nr:recombinase [Enterococcus faecium]